MIDERKGTEAGSEETFSKSCIKIIMPFIVKENLTPVLDLVFIRSRARAAEKTPGRVESFQLQFHDMVIQCRCVLSSIRKVY